MQFIHHSKQIYPVSSCDKMILLFENNISAASKGTAGSSYLDDLEITLTITDPLCYYGLGNSICSVIEQYKNLFPLIDSNIKEWKLNPSCQLMRYEPNNYYKIIHCENGGSSKHSSRVFAWMVYLNTIKEGGGTRFVHQDFTTQPVAGDAYIWPSYWTHFHHGVNAPYEKKYIVTGWVDYVL